MASEGSDSQSRGSTRVTWWVAAHKEHGLSEGMGWDGGGKVHLYEEIDRELIEEIKELNEDDLDKGWKAVRVVVEIID